MGYEVENDSVTYFGVPVQGANAAEFESLGDCYGRDRRRVFWRTREVEGADVETFRDLGFDWGADRDAVFECGRAKEGYDPATMKAFNEKYALDRNGAYLNGSPIPNVDPAQFGVWGGFMRIGDRCEYDGRPIDAHADTFRGVGGDYAVDDQRVYFRTKVVEGADASTFEGIGRVWGRDAVATYFGARTTTEAMHPSWSKLDADECRLRIEARAGDVDAMYEIAKAMMMEGDPTEAFVWAQLAIESGRKRTKPFLRRAMKAADPHEEAELEGALLYEAALRLATGSEVPRDVDNARQLLARAKEAGLLETTQVDLEERRTLFED